MSLKATGTCEQQLEEAPRMAAAELTSLYAPCLSAVALMPRLWLPTLPSPQTNPALPCPVFFRPVTHAELRGGGVCPVPPGSGPCVQVRQ
jgi:hypothetical protein